MHVARKWNKIEHRRFCHITQTWRGKPLISRQTVGELIASTTTRTGLKVRCELDTRSYQKGIKVSEAKMATLNIKGDTKSDHRRAHGNDRLREAVTAPLRVALSGCPLTTTMLEERTQFHRARLAEHIAACNGYGWRSPLAPIDRVVQAQATIMSYFDIFWLLGVLALCLWPLARFLPRMPKGAAPAH